jgi:glycosyltransferase involved in cell wall biosynthesis
MRARFIGDPAPTFARISSALDTLSAHDIPFAFIERRKAWVALRIARQLIMFGLYRQAARFLDRAAAEPDFARSWKVIQYRLRIGLGKAGLLRAHPLDVPPRQQRIGETRQFLIVTHDPVWPPVSGYDIRNWLIARSLSRHGAVVLASVRAPASAQTDIPAITLASIAPDGSAAGAKRLRRFRSAIEPRLAASSLTALNRLVSSHKFDMTVFAGVGLGGLMRAGRESFGAVTLDMHNVESDLLRQRHKRRGLPGRMAGLIQAIWAKRIERRAIEDADLVLSCSSQDRDRAIVLHRPRAPVLIVPNGSLRHADTIRDQKEAGSPPTILYAGHLGYWPNVEAAQRLAMRILPLVRQKVPEAGLVLAGRSPKPSVKALSDLPGVTIVADPPDMGAMLRTATLTIVPLESGGGTRIKVLEAMVEGVPVVATRLAVEGLDLAEGLDYLAAETDGDLAGAAASLLQNAELARAMSERARVRAISGFGDMAIDDAIDRVLKAAHLRSA